MQNKEMQLILFLTDVVHDSLVLGAKYYNWLMIDFYAIVI